MHILMAGSSGFLGRHLQGALRARGHNVTPLVRRSARAGERSWDPRSGHLDVATLEGIDVVVNLAGSPLVGNPHSAKWARELHDSRVEGTRVLAEAIAASDTRPVFLAGNGISYYGDHGSDYLDEDAESRGDALLTRVTRDWQAATAAAERAGARVVVLRTAPVLDKASPPLKQLRLLFKAGLGGRLGNGRQYFPVISRRDWVDAVCFLAEHEVSGPVNLCCPQAPTNAEFTRELAEQVGGRPSFLTVPAAAIRLAGGQMAPEVLGSVRARPRALLEAGFEFSDADITDVLRAGLL